MKYLFLQLAFLVTSVFLLGKYKKALNIFVAKILRKFGLKKTPYIACIVPTENPNSLYLYTEMTKRIHEKYGITSIIALFYLVDGKLDEITQHGLEGGHFDCVITLGTQATVETQNFLSAKQISIPLMFCTIPFPDIKLIRSSKNFSPLSTTGIVSAPLHYPYLSRFFRNLFIDKPCILFLYHKKNKDFNRIARLLENASDDAFKGLAIENVEELKTYIAMNNQKIDAVWLAYDHDIIALKRDITELSHTAHFHIFSTDIIISHEKNIAFSSPDPEYMVDACVEKILDILFQPGPVSRIPIEHIDAPTVAYVRKDSFKAAMTFIPHVPVAHTDYYKIDLGLKEVDSERKKVAVISYKYSLMNAKMCDGISYTFSERMPEAIFDNYYGHGSAQTIEKILPAIIQEKYDLICTLGVISTETTLRILEKSGCKIPVVYGGFTEKNFNRLKEKTSFANATGVLIDDAQHFELEQFVVTEYIASHVTKLLIPYNVRSQKIFQEDIACIKAAAEKKSIKVIEAPFAQDKPIKEFLSEFEGTFDGLMLLRDTVLLSHIIDIAIFCNERHLPFFSSGIIAAEQGASLGFGQDEKITGIELAHKIIDILSGKSRRNLKPSRIYAPNIMFNKVFMKQQNVQISEKAMHKFHDMKKNSKQKASLSKQPL